MLTDPISDMLTRIRNAGHAVHSTVKVPHSRVKEQIARIMTDEGFIAGYTVEGEVKKNIIVTLKYIDREPVIEHMERVSRPGRRNYSGADKLAPVQAGLGIAIISTSRGLLVDREARKSRVGGEVLCRIW